ncbi:MAG: MATE family efflux transporter [Lachnospiraceae bacterium]|uniref:MATE family efflux transporter n=1 Tax=Candidatus Weimeria bifida TaxID=2599074 RepID=A0A6N7IXR5_9FIRM|nr:MATE family efflux transporter [Candidatus Weimeria bifida]RRF95558.1 MAG: MATE family efflux transporter [Lachnospiraceae bacterium]
MKTKIFGDSGFRKELFSLALPIALQNLMLAAVAACDAIMLGRVSQNQMSAVSLAGQIQFVQNILLGASTGAAAILGAQYYGKGDRKTMDDIFSICLRLCLVVSTIFWVGCIFAPEMLMQIYTNEPELVALGARYLRITGWSYLLTGISEPYLTLMKVTGHAGAGAGVSCMAVILNIFFNAVFIYGLLGFPALNVRGAAVATLVSRIIEVIVAFVLSLRSGFTRLHWEHLFHTTSGILPDFLKCGFPLLVCGALWGIGFSSYTAILGHMGADAAAANSVSSVVRDLFCCAGNGLANGSSILLGSLFGAGKTEEGKRDGGYILRIGILTGIVTCLLVLAVTPFVLWFYVLSPEAKKLLSQIMVIMAFYMIGRVLNTIVINGIFYSGGDIMFDARSLVVTMWGIAIPLALLGAFVFHWPVPAVFACTCADEVGKIPWVMVHYRKYRWVRNLTKERPGV